MTLEQDIHTDTYYKHYRNKRLPKPNTPILCPVCLYNSYKLYYNKRLRYAPHYYWRYMKCMGCMHNYWIGVHFETNETIIPSLSPMNRGFYQNAVLYTYEDVKARRYRATAHYKYYPVATPEAADEAIRELFTAWLQANPEGLAEFDNKRLLNMFRRLHEMYKDMLITSKSKQEEPVT